MVLNQYMLYDPVRLLQTHNTYALHLTLSFPHGRYHIALAVAWLERWTMMRAKTGGVYKEATKGIEAVGVGEGLGWERII